MNNIELLKVIGQLELKLGRQNAAVNQTKAHIEALKQLKAK